MHKILEVISTQNLKIYLKIHMLTPIFEDMFLVYTQCIKASYHTKNIMFEGMVKLCVKIFSYNVGMHG